MLIRIMVFTETESLSLHCNGLALHAHTQHEAATQRSAGQRGGLGVKGVAFLGGYGQVAAPANKPPSVKNKNPPPASSCFAFQKQEASRVNPTPKPNENGTRLACIPKPSVIATSHGRLEEVQPLWRGQADRGLRSPAWASGLAGGVPGGLPWVRRAEEQAPPTHEEG